MALKASSILGDPTGLMVIDRSRADCCHTLGAVGTTAATFFSEAVQFVFQGWRAGSPRQLFGSHGPAEFGAAGSGVAEDFFGGGFEHFCADVAVDAGLPTGGECFFYPTILA